MLAARALLMGPGALEGVLRHDHGVAAGHHQPLDRSEGEAAIHQRNTGDATDDRNRRIHGSKEIRLNAGAADDAPVVRFTAQLPAPSSATTTD
jgi:hypothetical protein